MTKLSRWGNPAPLDMCISAATPSCRRLVVVGNLPSVAGLSAEALQRDEIWVTSTFRFPSGLDRALALVSSGLDVDCLVEPEVGLDGLSEAMSVAKGIDPPLKIQITPRPNLLHLDHARTDQHKSGNRSLDRKRRNRLPSEQIGL